MRRCAAIGFVTAGVLLASCGRAVDPGGTTQAGRRTGAREDGATSAQVAYLNATLAFCADAQTDVAALDGYLEVLDTGSSTVGAIAAAGAELVARHRASAADAQAVVVAGAALRRAHGGSAGDPVGVRRLQAATVGRVATAASDLAAASDVVPDDTPVTEMPVGLEAAALGLEEASTGLLVEAGCVTDPDRRRAHTVVRDYTLALQADLREAGTFHGDVDGVYGPTVVGAIERVQAGSSLPVSGAVGDATAAALQLAIAGADPRGGASALASTAATQAMLRVAGAWAGPVDGRWTVGLSLALGAFQVSRGLPATAAVDAWTLRAIAGEIAGRGRRAPKDPASEPPRVLPTLRWVADGTSA